MSSDEELQSVILDLFNEYNDKIKKFDNFPVCFNGWLPPKRLDLLSMEEVFIWGMRDGISLILDYMARKKRYNIIASNDMDVDRFYHQRKSDNEE